LAAGEQVLAQNAGAPSMADIVIVNPRFGVSFWGMEQCMGLLGKRANLPVSCLALLAALVPKEHDVTVIDENVEEIDFERLERADLICLTGMNVQGHRMREILERVRNMKALKVVGGPLATVEPEEIEDLADVIFIGEADLTWPEFLKEWPEGRHKRRYEQREKTDMSTLPLPRLDLLKTQHYMFGSMQISRGCPFTCEFCDIIVTFGRKPRLKTSAQVIAEFEAYVSAGFKILFVVDDNLIGNKKAIKPVLRDIEAWQKRRGYPLVLFTEASLDLADDPELIELMGRANFQSVFIGIESPNEESLKETKKLQNVRAREGTMLERVHRIQENGLDVWCGMIVGFDNDDASAFALIPDFLEEARIGNAMVGLLHAIPTTPLHERLKRDGRLSSAEDADLFGTNVVPVKMTPEDLRDGYRNVTRTVYGAQSYFERIDALYIDNRFKYAAHHLPYWRENRWRYMQKMARNYVAFSILAARLMRQVEHPELRQRYQRQLMRILRARPLEPAILFNYAIKVALHYHYASIVHAMEACEGVPTAARSFSRMRRPQSSAA
jgi:radical SAM superfamily enzyme YgiQ (UPF0313 family)